MHRIVRYATGTWSQLPNAFLIHKFLILDIYHLGNLYLCEEDMGGIRGYFSKPKGPARKKNARETLVSSI